MLLYELQILKLGFCLLLMQDKILIEIIVVPHVYGENKVR